MRILLVTQYFWPEAIQINNLALDLKKNGHDVVVLTGIPNYPGGSYYSGYKILNKFCENYSGMRIFRIPLISRGKGSSFRLALNYLSFAFLASLISPFVCRGNFDIIFVCLHSPVTVGLPGLLLKKLKKAPLVFWAQDLWPESLTISGAVRSPVLLKCVWKLTQFIYKGSDMVLTQSRAFTSYINRFGVPDSDIKYFPNSAVVQESLLDKKIPEKFKLPAGFCIVYAGNMAATQSLITVIKAALLLKEYTDIHWIMIGDGRERTWLEEQVKINDLGLNMHFLGYKSFEVMPYYFMQASALLVTLKKEPIFAVTVPSKIQPYLAYGKPIIASLDGEAARIIDEAQAGLVSSAEDAELLAENALILYNTEASKRETMGQNGRKYFEQHFESKRLIKQLEGWMEDLIREKQCGS